MDHKNILTPAQAQSVYDAMCALNNVNATLSAWFDISTERERDVLLVVNQEVGLDEITVTVFNCGAVVSEERYASQFDFAVVYGFVAA